MKKEATPLFVALNFSQYAVASWFLFKLRLIAQGLLFSDLRKRIAVEGDAITRAKEFLRRQRRSVQRRQVSVKVTLVLSYIFSTQITAVLSSILTNSEFWPWLIVAKACFNSLVCLNYPAVSLWRTSEITARLTILQNYYWPEKVMEEKTIAFQVQEKIREIFNSLLIWKRQGI